ncbi:unnamed protein product (macronuclear) [Paramecium tetraurelia]|uniref:Uncharacterized protein n=1 Tax=Paramecium tetraurelia TaxID=5888 RepID=A0CIF7_PARTE|nr:uncharacterized protein GSPATT00007709001 [Paramecium tetraurelia]CAK70574.1 unnamed protein product [Paramecium tetraurelia]|eukprot:XP_001437971.1 hypothetical protein (macronuclear) [Paramecium tetraurelia strain d4-2]
MLIFFVFACLVSAQTQVKVTGTVMDSQGINIAGVHITLFQQQQTIVSGQTKDDGKYELITQINQVSNLFVEASLYGDLQTPQRYAANPDSNGNIVQDFILTVDDVTVNGPAVLAKINGQYFNKNAPLNGGASYAPLEGVKIDYSIEYILNGKHSYEFASASNTQGLSKIFTVYPKSAAILKFLAQSENFWNFRQTKDNDENFVLIVTNQYKVNYQVIMEEGVFTQTVLGTVVDKNSKKPLKDAKVEVTFSSESKGKLSSQSLLTKDDGKIEVKYISKLWYKFTIKISITKEYYALYEQSKTIEMDHDDRTKNLDTFQLGMIEMPVQPSVTLFGFVLDPHLKDKDTNLKPVVNLPLQVIAKFENLIEKFETQTDSNGQWTKDKLLLQPSAKYDLEITYTNSQKEKFTDKFSFTTTLDPVQKIKIDNLYYQDVVNAALTGKFSEAPEKMQFKIPYKITCDTLDNKLNLPKEILAQTGGDEIIDKTWSVEARGDKDITCSLQQQDSAQFIQPFSKQFILQKGIWKADLKQIDIKYNLFDIVIGGTVLDKAQLVPFISGANMNFVVYQKDETLHTLQREFNIKSDEKGLFSLKFQIGKGEKSIVKLTVSHPDFIDYKKEELLIINGNGPQTLNGNSITLDRIEFTDVILHYKIDTLEQPATLKLNSCSPFMEVDKLYSPKYDSNDGSFKIQFACYQNVIYKATLEITIKSFSAQTIQSHQFTCVKPTKEKPEIELTSDSLFIKGNLIVKFLDVNNRPIKGQQATFRTEPLSQVLTQTSDDQGTMKFVDTKLFKNQQYTGLLAYGSQNAELKFYPKQDNFEEHFQDQYIGGQVQYKVTGKVKLCRGQLVNPLQVNVKCGKYPEQTGKTDLEGSFSISIQAVGNFNDVVQCTTKISGDVDYSFDSTFTKGTYSVYQDVSVCLKDIKLNVLGKFIDPINQPKPNLQITLSVVFQEDQKPIPNIPSLKTDANGLWDLKDQIVKANGKYKFILKYKNGAGDEKTIEKDYQTSVYSVKPTSDYEFPNTFYQDFEQCHVFGKANDYKSKNIVPAALPVVLTCDQTLSKDKKPIKQSGKIGFDLQYDLKVDGLVEYDQPIQCQLKSENEAKAKFNQNIQLQGPKWEIKQDLTIQYITWLITLKGQVLDPLKINTNLKDAIITITVHQPVPNKLQSKLRGRFHFDVQQTQLESVNSKEQGLYQIEFQTLNQEALSIDIAAKLTDFNDFKQLNALSIAGTKNEELTFNINLQRIEFSAILSSSVDEIGSILFKTSNPLMQEDKDKKFYGTSVVLQKGKPFQFNVKCNQNVEYVATFILTNEHQQQMEYMSDPFKCKVAPELTVIKIKSTNDKFLLKISGIIKDKEKLFDGIVSGATVIINLTKNTKVVKSIQTTSNNKGEYQGQFEVNTDTYQYEIKVTHPQFKDGDISDTIVFSKNEVVTRDVILERQTNTQKITINLQDSKKKPIKNSEVGTSDFKPKSNDKKIVKADDTGKATIEVVCFKDVQETFKLEIRVEDLRETVEQTISCDGKSQDHSIMTQLQYVNINGNVIDPYCKGKSDLKLNLDTTPETQKVKVNTDKKGDWEGELLVKLNQEYSVNVNYNGWDGQQQSLKEKYQIKSDQTSLDFQKIYYSDQVESSVQGEVVSSVYHVSLKFHKISLWFDSKEVKESEIDEFSEYEMKFKVVAQCNKEYEYQIQIKETQHFERKTVPLIIKPPKYDYKVDIVVEETKAYINEIKNFFSKFLISGYLESEYNCKDKLFRAVQHAQVKIVKKQESGDKVKAATHTREDGKFQLYFFLSKSQVKNNIFVWLHFEKEGFTTPYPLLIIPSQYEKFQMDDETITHIDIGYQSISPIQDMGCPEDIPKISNNDQSTILIDYIKMGKKQLKGNNN